MTTTREREKLIIYRNQLVEKLYSITRSVEIRYCNLPTIPYFQIVVLYFSPPIPSNSHPRKKSK